MKQKQPLFLDSLNDRQFGSISVGVTIKGLRVISFGHMDSPGSIDKYARRFNLQPIADKNKTFAVMTQIKEYFAGKRKSFDADLDLAHLTDFSRKVLMAAYHIPYGQTATYRQLAASAGSIAYRAVGQVMAHNPIPIIIPCHRIIGTNGSLTGFGGGIEMKRRLLALEGIIIE